MLGGFQVFVSGVALVAVTLAGASTAAAQQPAAPAEPAKPVLTINSDAAIITLLIKPDKTADFEVVLNKLKEALAKSEKPERKQQAAGWKIFKSTQMAAGQRRLHHAHRPGGQGAGVRHQPPHRRSVPGRSAGALREVQGRLRGPRHQRGVALHDDVPQ